MRNSLNEEFKNAGGRGGDKNERPRRGETPQTADNAQDAAVQATKRGSAP